MQRKFLTFRTRIKRLPEKLFASLNLNSHMIRLSALISIDLSLVKIGVPSF